jgi:phage repressor protein C with HTH and peptisase S24 domain
MMGSGSGDDREIGRIPERHPRDESSVSDGNDERGAGARADIDPTLWDTDRIVRLAGEAILSDPDHPIWKHEAFLEWLREDLRQGDSRQRRFTDEQRIALGTSFMLRVEARKLAVRRAEGTAPARKATIVARPKAAVDLASREEAAPLVDLSVAAGAGRELWDEVVDQWVVLPDDVPNGRYLALRITGDSMEPIMHTGDVVLVRLGGPIKAGTVIVARHPEDGYMCKKVRRVRADRIELESLKPGRPLIRLPRNPALILGTVVMVWCEHAQSMRGV